MRIVALVAAYNEELFIDRFLEHLIGNGVVVYLLDNESRDSTVPRARRFLGRGLLAIETLPRRNGYCLPAILQRKEELASSLPADWFLSADPDEMELPPRPGSNLAEAFREVEAEGYDAVNFQEFTFLPTREEPDHEGRDYPRTMRWYYPFLPFATHLVRAWKRSAAPVELAWSGGHAVRFPGIRIAPRPFPMRHFFFLSVPHAIRKWVRREFDPAAVARGWHGWRARLRPEMIRLPRKDELREWRPESGFDGSNPRPRHFLDECVASFGPPPPSGAAAG
jgi:hypothetical protein